MSAQLLVFLYIYLMSRFGLVRHEEVAQKYVSLCFVLLGGNVTAAFEAQRHAEPHGPLASISLHMMCTLLKPHFPQTLIGFPPVLTGEL